MHNNVTNPALDVEEKTRYNQTFIIPIKEAIARLEAGGITDEAAEEIKSKLVMFTNVALRTINKPTLSCNIERITNGTKEKYIQRFETLLEFFQRTN